MKSAKKLILSITIVLGTAISGLVALPTTSTHAVSADICSQSGVPADIKKANGCGGEGDNLQPTIQKILSAFIGIMGVVAVIFIVVGGVNYITSNGDTGKIEKAKKTIMFSIIGLIICIISFAIVNFVINSTR